MTILSPSGLVLTTVVLTMVTLGPVLQTSKC
jgi:hypothetical protein